MEGRWVEVDGRKVLELLMESGGFRGVLEDVRAKGDGRRVVTTSVKFSASTAKSEGLLLTLDDPLVIFVEAISKFENFKLSLR